MLGIMRIYSHLLLQKEFTYAKPCKFTYIYENSWLSMKSSKLKLICELKISDFFIYILKRGLINLILDKGIMKILKRDNKIIWKDLSIICQGKFDPANYQNNYMLSEGLSTLVNIITIWLVSGIDVPDQVARDCPIKTF